MSQEIRELIEKGKDEHDLPIARYYQLEAIARSLLAIYETIRPITPEEKTLLQRLLQK